MIYFATAREASAVKIGYSGDPHIRMTEVQVGCPFKVKLEAVLPGTLADERALHGRFSDARLNGEWFRITPFIEAIIAANPPPAPPVVEEPDAPFSKLAEEFRVTRAALAERLGLTIPEFSAYEGGRSIGPELKAKIKSAAGYYARKQAKLEMAA